MATVTATVSVEYFDTSSSAECIAKADAATAWFTSSATNQVNAVGPVPPWTDESVSSMNLKTGSGAVNNQVLKVSNFSQPLTVQLSSALPQVQQVAVLIGTLDIPAPFVPSNNLLITLQTNGGNPLALTGGLPPSQNGFSYQTSGSALQISGPAQPSMLPVVTLTLSAPVSLADGLQVTFATAGTNSFQKWNYAIQAVYFGASSTQPLYAYPQLCQSVAPVSPSPGPGPVSPSPAAPGPGKTPTRPPSPGAPTPGTPAQKPFPVWAIAVIASAAAVLALGLGLGLGLRSRKQTKAAPVKK